MKITKTALTHARLLVAATALALLAAACATTSSGPERERDAAVRTEKDAPAETEPTQPEVPEAARNVDASGARAAARYLLELEHHAVITGDLSEWKRVSLPDCEYCAETVERVEGDLAAGERFEGGAVAVDGSALPVEADGTFLTRTLVSMSAGATYAADGAVVEEWPAATLLVDLDLRQVGGTWRIADGNVYLVPYAVPRADHPDQAV